MSRSVLSFGVLVAFVVAPVAEAAPAKDPKIVVLANAAAKCKFEEGSFDDECKAHKAWQDEEKLFEEGKGDLTILAMFEDPEVKMRVLASEKGFDSADKILGDKANALRVIAAAKKETNTTVARSFASYVARIDIEKLGLEAELKALAKHPVSEFRDSLGFYLYSGKQTPLRLEVTKTLLGDSEPKVQSGALKGLSMGAARGKAKEACALMGEQIARPDSDALWQVGTSNCTSIYDALAAELLKRSSDPVRAAKDGVSLSLAIGSMCREGNDAQKKKGFTAAKALTDAKVKNVNARTAGIGELATCDKAAAKPVLTALAKDGDKYVAEKATKELGKLDKK